MKKIIAFALVLVFALSAGASCFAEPVTPTAEAVDAQISLIFSSFETFRQNDPDQTWYYAVTDLDHNGRLEILAASVQGTELNTTLMAWEVNADNNAFASCGVGAGDNGFFPDVVKENADTFYDAKRDEWYYIFNDNRIVSATEAFTDKCAVRLKNTSMSFDVYATQHAQIENGITVITYTGQNGEILTPEAFNAAGIDAFAGLQRTSTNLDWFVLSGNEEASRFADSYAIFSGAKQPENESAEALTTAADLVTAPAAAAAPQAAAAPAATSAPQVVNAPNNGTPQVVYDSPEAARAAEGGTVVYDSPSAFLMVTKDPTSENRFVGDTALFVANANAWNSLSWTFVAPSGGEYSWQNFTNLYPYCTLRGTDGTTLSINNVSTDMNGWGVYCTFYNNGQTARTNTAYLYVGVRPAATPQATIAGNAINGTVSDFLMSTVTILLNNGRTIQVPRDICSVNGTLSVGSACTVYYSGNEPTAKTINYVYITGQTPYYITPDTTFIYNGTGSGTVIYPDGAVIGGGTVVGGGNITVSGY